MNPTTLSRGVNIILPIFGTRKLRPGQEVICCWQSQEQDPNLQRASHQVTLPSLLLKRLAPEPKPLLPPAVGSACRIVVYGPCFPDQVATPVKSQLFLWALPIPSSFSMASSSSQWIIAGLLEHAARTVPFAADLHTAVAVG